VVFKEIDATLFDVQGMVSMRNPDELRELMHRYEELNAILPEGIAQARRVFGEQTQLELEVVSDPEADEGDTLFAYIVSDLDVQDALNLMDRLDAEWYLSLPAAVLDIFNFNLLLR